MMELLFSQEEVWEMTKREVARDAGQEGRQEGFREGRQEGAEDRDLFYSELLKRLEPLGRTDELLAAIANPPKLKALAQEFCLTM